VTEQNPSFTRGIFAGVVLDSLLFPYPRRLDERNPDEARTVRRLIKELRFLEGDVIDSGKFDEEETIPENVIRAFAEIGMLGAHYSQKVRWSRALVVGVCAGVRDPLDDRCIARCSRRRPLRAWIEGDCASRQRSAEGPVSAAARSCVIFSLRTR